jgi:hypothetical protein
MLISRLFAGSKREKTRKEKTLLEAYLFNPLWTRKAKTCGLFKKTTQKNNVIRLTRRRCS